MFGKNVIFHQIDMVSWGFRRGSDPKSPETPQKTGDRGLAIFPETEIQLFSRGGRSQTDDG